MKIRAIYWSPVGSPEFALFLAIGLLALAVRVLWLTATLVLAGPQACFEPDSVSYIGPARMLLLGNGYSTLLPDGRLVPETMRTPGYPALLALAMKLGRETWWISILRTQTVLGAVLVVVLGVVLRHCVSLHAALVAMAYYTLSLSSIISCSVIMTENLFTFTATLGLLLILVAALDRQLPTHRRKAADSAYLAPASALLGFAALLRPAAIYASLLTLVVGALNGWPKTPWSGHIALHPARARKTLNNLVYALLPFSLLVGGWIVRNGLATGYWGLTSITEVSLLFYRGVPALAQSTGTPVEILSDHYVGFFQLDNPWDQSPEALARRPAMRTEAVRLVLANSASYAKNCWDGFRRLAYGFHQAEVSRLAGPGIARRLQNAAKYPMMGIWLLACSALVVWPPTRLLAGFLAVYLITVLGYEAYERFRIPVEPLLALGLGISFHLIVQRLYPRRLSDSQRQSDQATVRQPASGGATPRT